jgi:PAS domain S-box-containing protein
MTDGPTITAQDDPLGIAFEALQGDDPLIQSAKQLIWRRLWARDNVVAWINMTAEMPALRKSLHYALPQDDVELLENIKMVAEKFGNSPSAFLIIELANERIERCQSISSDSVPPKTDPAGSTSPASARPEPPRLKAQRSMIESDGLRYRPINVPSAVLYPWVFDYTPLGVIRVDTEGRCEYANRKFAAISGEPSFQGHNIRELFPDEQNGAIIEEQLKIRFEQRRPDDYDIVLTRLDNRRSVHVRVAATPVLDSTGRAVGAIAIFRELTYELAVKRITQAIATCQNSEELLGAVSNEIRQLIPFDQLHVSAYSRDKQYVRSLFSDPRVDPKFKVRWFKMSPAMAKFASNLDISKIEDMDEYYSQPGFITLKPEDLKKQGWLDRPRSLLRCPVARRGRVVASLSIGRRRPNSFSDANYELFNSLPIREAVTMALYLEDKQNLKFRLDLMGSIFKDWGDQEKVASVIVHQLLEHNDWDHAAFFHVDEKRQEIRLLSQKAKNDDPGFLLPTNYQQQLNSGVLGFVYRSQQAVNIGDLAHDAQFNDIAMRGFKSEILSELCLPIVLGDRVCWMLNLEDSRENAFSSEEVADLEIILDELKNLLEGVLARHFVETTIDSASDAIIAVDGAGCVIRANPAVEGLLGYSPKELKGRTFLFLLDSRRLLDEVTDGRRLFCEQVNLKRKDGTEVAVLLSASPLPQALGGAVFLARDLSLMKRLKELEYLGRMYQEIAIQTKTPLSLAFSWLQTIEGKDKETVDKINRELQKVQLTYDRLALYEESEGFMPFHEMLLKISEVISRLLDTVPESERHKIDVTLEPNLPLIRGDLYQLTFCLRTILSYLIRFVPQNGHIQVRVSREGRGLCIRIIGFLPSPDDVGIQPESATWIAQVLADMALGEKVIRSFVERHHGIYYQPKKHQDFTEFRIDLPSSDAAVP